MNAKGNANSHSEIHPDAMRIFMLAMKNRPIEEKNRALELAVAIGIPPDDPSFLFAAACGYLETLLEAAPKEWEKLLLAETPAQLRTLLLTEAPTEWIGLFNKFLGKIQSYENTLGTHESQLTKTLEKEEKAAVKRVEAGISEAAGLLLQKARNSLRDEQKEQQRRQFYWCLAISLGALGSTLLLGAYLGSNYINTKFQEPRNVFARNLYYWNVERLAKCQKDKKPQCTLWITQPSKKR